eukprot:gnl/MRDRNA2_/MRDRNA2_159820_c0_seq1.p1 gnl/MRDRNA2_/MRDRNA2_159820_c0~~gnl/MRDRNA2_/MRDRNA2_159820_c0_seq1.p1  ORF type:complete len:379 (-),score=53.47 gnl/MRDRNA2_/MRDRNA2_159820_c0_seq1:2-1042(-)
MAACEGLCSVVMNCWDDTRLKHQLQVSLTTIVDNHQSLAQKIAAAHLSNGDLQYCLMYIIGFTGSCSSVVSHMHLHSNSHTVQLAALKTLGSLFTDIDELTPDNMAARPVACRAIIDAMRKCETLSAQPIELLHKSCSALSAIVDHGCDGYIDQEALTCCLGAALRVVTLINEKIGGWTAWSSRPADKNAPWSVHALYLLKESCRVLVSVFNVAPDLVQNFQSCIPDLRIAFEAIASTNLGRERQEHKEESLRFLLTALCQMSGASTAVEALRTASGNRPTLLWAAVNTMVHLFQHGRGAELCCAEVYNLLLSVAEMHAKRDKDLHSRLMLAAGFAGGGDGLQTMS